MKLSICIPVYNTDITYLNECISSILNQGFDGYEIIVVDDGSSQRYRETLVEFCQINTKIKLLLRSHSGLRGARVAAFREARGEYVLCIDSDDCLVGNDALGKLVDFLESRNKPDIACFNATESLDRPKKIVEYGAMFEKTIDVDKDEFIIKFSKTYKLNNLCFKCFRRELTEKLELDEQIQLNMCEDRLFTAQILRHASTVSILDSILYFYRQHDNSMVKRRFSIDNYYQRAQVERIVEQIIIEITGEHIHNYASRLKWCVGDLCETRRTISIYAERVEIYRKIASDVFFLESIDGCIKSKDKSGVDARLVATLLLKKLWRAVDVALLVRNQVVSLIKRQPALL